MWPGSQIHLAPTPDRLLRGAEMSQAERSQNLGTELQKATFALPRTPCVDAVIHPALLLITSSCPLRPGRDGDVRLCQCLDSVGWDSPGIPPLLGSLCCRCVLWSHPRSRSLDPDPGQGPEGSLRMRTVRFPMP